MDLAYTIIFQDLRINFSISPFVVHRISSSWPSSSCIAALAVSSTLRSTKAKPELDFVIRNCLSVSLDNSYSKIRRLSPFRDLF